MKCETCPSSHLAVPCPGESHARVCGLPEFRGALLAAVEGRVFESSSPVVFRTYIQSYTGYSQNAEMNARALESIGLPVAFLPINFDERFLPVSPWVKSRVHEAASSPWEVLFACPVHPATPGKKTVRFTMNESTAVPGVARTFLNAAEALIVPSRWVEETFRADGVVSPIFVAPHGVDLSVFRPAASPRPPGGHVVFGTSGRHAHGGARKGCPEVVRAFLAAFPVGTRGSDRVRLRVKIWPDCEQFVRFPPEMLADPRIDVIRNGLTAEGLAEWYRSLDCFVSGSCGEGFGMQPLQALACGVPVAATQWSGHTEYFDWNVGYPLPYVMEEGYGDSGFCGMWARPTHEGLVRAMRSVRADPDLARSKGAAGAVRALGFTWHRSALAMRVAFESVGLLARPVAPDPSIFVPDPLLHARIVAGVGSCGHRVDVSGCCGPAVACGPGGSRPGVLVATADCYPCVRDSLDSPPPGPFPMSVVGPRQIFAGPAPAKGHHLAVSVTVYNRPEYLRRCLDALARCSGVSDCLLLLAVEPGDCDDLVRAVIGGFTACECRPTYNAARLGQNANLVRSMDYAFASGRGFAVHVEADDILAPDALDFFAHCRDAYRLDPRVFSATAYSVLGREQDVPHESVWHSVDWHRWFHPWTWATWPDRWVDARRGVVNLHESALPWDVALNNFGRDRGMGEVYPILSRVQNIGRVSSTGPVDEEWLRVFDRVVKLRHWAGDLEVPPGVWSRAPEFVP